MSEAELHSRVMASTHGRRDTPVGTSYTVNQLSDSHSSMESFLRWQIRKARLYKCLSLLALLVTFAGALNIFLSGGFSLEVIGDTAEFVTELDSEAGQLAIAVRNGNAALKRITDSLTEENQQKFRQRDANWSASQRSDAFSNSDLEMLYTSYSELRVSTSEIEGSVSRLRRLSSRFEKDGTEPDKAVAAYAEILSIGITRIGAVLLFVYMIQILVGFFRYFTRLETYYSARLASYNAFDTTAETQNPFLELLHPEEITFGKDPDFPASRLVEILKLTK